MYAPALRAIARTLIEKGLAEKRLKMYQDSLLQQTVRHVYENTSFYRRKFDEAGMTPDAVKGVEDLPKIPFFTTGLDIQGDPAQFLAVPKEELRHRWTTAGTTGKPKEIFYTDEDINHLRRISTLSMSLSEMGQQEVAQICYAFGDPAWLVGPFLQEILEAAGCTVLACGNQISIEEQIQAMSTHGTTLLFGTPSYIHRLTEEGRRLADLRSFKVRMISLGAEPWSESFREYLRKAWGAEVVDGYGMTEMGYLVAGECPARDGLHVSMDIALEVVDPATGVPVEPGQEGELILTTLHRKGMPLIRYRSGDISRLLTETPCPCGLISTPRIARVKCRADDMTFLGTGENIYPGQFDQVVLPIERVAGYQVVIGREGYKDSLHIRVETDLPSEALKQEIVEQLYLGISFLRHDVMNSQTIAAPVVEFIEPGTLARETPIKIRRIVDRRRWD